MYETLSDNEDPVNTGKPAIVLDYGSGPEVIPAVRLFEGPADKLILVGEDEGDNEIFRLTPGDKPYADLVGTFKEDAFKRVKKMRKGSVLTLDVAELDYDNNAPLGVKYRCVAVKDVAAAVKADKPWAVRF